MRGRAWGLGCHRAGGVARVVVTAVRAAFWIGLALSVAAATSPAAAQQIFNGSQTTPNGAVNGGGGVWDTTTTNWTGFFGATSTAYDPASSGTLFGSSGPSTPATGGTVTVTPGGVQLTSLVGFDLTGDGSVYTIQGGDLRLATGGTIFITNNVAGTTDPSAIIASRIVGSGGHHTFRDLVSWRCSAPTPIPATLSSARARRCSLVTRPTPPASSAPSSTRAPSTSSMPTRRASRRSPMHLVHDLPERDLRRPMTITNNRPSISASRRSSTDTATPAKRPSSMTAVAIDLLCADQCRHGQHHQPERRRHRYSLDQSSAGSATILNKDFSGTVFGTLGGSDTATAGNATIINEADGRTNFAAFTTAGNATIITKDGGTDLVLRQFHRRHRALHHHRHRHCRFRGQPRPEQRRPHHRRLDRRQRRLLHRRRQHARRRRQ